MRRRRYIENADSLREARRIRETFTDRPPERVETFNWDWPQSMVQVGTCEAVMYASDKWRQAGDMQDYKHVAEGPQVLLVAPGFLREYESPRTKLPVCGPEVELDGPMPDAIAVLAPILGVQTKLYVDDGGGDYYLPNGDESLYQVDIANAWLGGAKHPATGQTFLIVYTKRGGPCCIVTGEILDIEKDGIVG